MYDAGNITPNGEEYIDKHSRKPGKTETYDNAHAGVNVTTNHGAITGENRTAVVGVAAIKDALFGSAAVGAFVRTTGSHDDAKRCCSEHSESPDHSGGGRRAEDPTKSKFAKPDTDEEK